MRAHGEPVLNPHGTRGPTGCQQGTVVSSDHVLLPSVVSWPNFQPKNELVVFGAPSSTIITRLLQGQLIVLAHFHLLKGAPWCADFRRRRRQRRSTNREIGLIAYRVTSSMTFAAAWCSSEDLILAQGCRGNINSYTKLPRIDRPTIALRRAWRPRYP